MPQVECGFSGQTDLLVLIGPSLNVQIGFDTEYRPDSQSIPTLPTSEYHALTDTGASESCIDVSIATAAALRLPIINERSVAGVHGAGTVNVYLAQIHIPSLDFVQYGGFCGVHLHAGGQPHSALLGRNFLAKMTMTYQGDTGSVLLSYP